MRNMDYYILDTLHKYEAFYNGELEDTFEDVTNVYPECTMEDIIRVYDNNINEDNNHEI